MTRFVLTAAFGAFIGLAMLPALAQRVGGERPVSIRPKADETLNPARPAPPPALPGARSQRGASPATKPAADMSPNDALFDAINRGDLAAARESLNRGADLYAQNILGMTPMELSVDLGRNDISFLLLSMRGEAPRPARTAEQAEARKASANPQAGRKPTSKATVVRSAPVRTPVLFARDGGAPVPEAGFLGFDAGRAMR